MSKSVLLDNDVVLKSCVYRCHGEVVTIATIDQEPPALLSIARFALRSRLRANIGLKDPSSAAEALEELLAKVRLLEPSDDEIRLAAELEESATGKGFEFDTGESQLVAILLERGYPLLITGDKRAIVAMAGIGLPEAKGRVACLEQLFAIILAETPFADVRTRICAEATTDKALTACFACASHSITVEDVSTGLNSYINDLRARSGEMLVASLGAEVA